MQSGKPKTIYPHKVAKTKKNFIKVSDLVNMTYGELLKLGFLHPTKLRNNQIREEFHRLMATNKYLVTDCLSIIADDYCVSEETVRGIIYRKELP